MAIAVESQYGPDADIGTSAPSITGISVTGNDRFLIYALLLEVTVSCNSVVFDDGAGGGSQSFVQIGSHINLDAGNFGIWLWGLVAPTTGSGRRILASLSGSTNTQQGAVNYTGVDQTTPTTDADTFSDTSSPTSHANTSNLDGSWHFGIANNPYNGMSLTAGGVERQQVGTAASVGWIVDSNAGIDSGADNTFSWTFSTEMGGVFAMMRPAGGGGAGQKLLNLLGVGT